MEPYFQDEFATVYQGDVLEVLRKLPDQSVNTCVTSPPYWGLRSYGIPTTDWPQIEFSPMAGLPTFVIPAMTSCLGLEPDPYSFIAHLVYVFREVKRVLREDGTVFCNLGDSYANHTKWGGQSGGKNYTSAAGNYQGQRVRRGKDCDPKRGRAAPGQPLIVCSGSGLKPKDLVMIPARAALALQADGWFLRQDIVWCLSGGTWLYARTQKGDMPIMVRDLARLKPSTVKLWNGETWTKVLGWSKSRRSGKELEIVLRSGERISCTATHKFPTSRGLLPASELEVGDTLESCRLPQPEFPKDCVLDEDAAWFAGLYLAEGSRCKDKIQIAGHTREIDRLKRVQQIAAKFGGSASYTISGNSMNIRVFGKILNAIIDELVSGRTAHDKGFSPIVWRYSDKFLAAMVDGYLSGDGSFQGDRWRLGFCRNYNLERDLRTVCARLGYTLTLNLATASYQGGQKPSFRGELRKERSGHHNEKSRFEVVEIRNSRCREVYDIGVGDDPHLFSLASGVLTHNSKPNPMPESITDRCTKAHEYIFLLSKNQRYYFNQEAILEECVTIDELEWAGHLDGLHSGESHMGQGSTRRFRKGSAHSRGTGLNPKAVAGWATGPGDHSVLTHNSPNNGSDKKLLPRSKQNPSFSAAISRVGVVDKRNKRSVWTVPSEPFAEAHFATFPRELIKPCILAGCPGPGKRCDCQEVIESPLLRNGGDRALGAKGSQANHKEVRSAKGAAFGRGAGWRAALKTDEDPTMFVGRAGMERPRREGEGTRPITRFQQRHYAEQFKTSPHRDQMASESVDAFEHYIRTDRAGARPAPQELLDLWLDRGWIVLAPEECDCPLSGTGTVLDPFAGSLTTMQVAASLQCKSIGIELNPEYIDIGIRSRLSQSVLNFTQGDTPCSNPTPSQ